MFRSFQSICISVLITSGGAFDSTWPSFTPAALSSQVSESTHRRTKRRHWQAPVNTSAELSADVFMQGHRRHTHRDGAGGHVRHGGVR